MKYICCW